MQEEDQLRIIIQKINLYNNDIYAGLIDRGYGSMHNGFWFNRTKIDEVSVLAVSTFHPEITLPFELNKTHAFFNGDKFQYDMVNDKDSYFAQSTIDDIRMLGVQDFEVLRKFFTKVTGYVFRQN